MMHKKNIYIKCFKYHNNFSKKTINFYFLIKRFFLIKIPDITYYIIENIKKTHKF